MPKEQAKAQMTGMSEPSQLLAHDDDERSRIDHFRQRVFEHGLTFTDKEFDFFSLLSTPQRLQLYLDSLDYNYELTTMSPVKVREEGAADCFEGAFFAFACLKLHGFDAKLVVLAGRDDLDHNLVIYPDPVTGLWGAVAHPNPYFGGRPSIFPDIRSLVFSYLPHYSKTRDPQAKVNITTLGGYSAPIDVTEDFGWAWITQLEPISRIYWSYVKYVPFYKLQNGRPYEYSLNRAIREGWITVVSGQAHINSDHFPNELRKLWEIYWEIFQKDPFSYRELVKIEDEFFAKSGTTPKELKTNVTEVKILLSYGFGLDVIVDTSIPFDSVVPDGKSSDGYTQFLKVYAGYFPTLRDDCDRNVRIDTLFERARKSRADLGDVDDQDLLPPDRLLAHAEVLLESTHWQQRARDLKTLMKIPQELLAFYTKFGLRERSRLLPYAIVKVRPESWYNGLAEDLLEETRAYESALTKALTVHRRLFKAGKLLQTKTKDSSLKASRLASLFTSMYENGRTILCAAEREYTSLFTFAVQLDLMSAEFESRIKTMIGDEVWQEVKIVKEDSSSPPFQFQKRYP